ncbi:MAG: 1-(5-phosphoribosyl)-5-[(5-phosphoribosylamino)methylideneamino]imidazole-4-carboxamide isomerase [Firmicutes bacterium]|nr:1-(5-phosphoribosyl)-5-[(5-phosphoribosylamino)methylideneamino]imidazole-4-carboxamide isomerase [Bacillota bacterium]
MLIIPAIDIIDGQCVRLEQGDYEKKTVYSNDPVEIALDFQAEGAELIHLVDLDGAKAGQPLNLEVVSKIVQALEVPVELGGGIRDLATVRRVLDLGVERVILGTVVLNKPEWFEQAVAEYGERIVVGIDARNGYVAVQGWLQTTEKRAFDLALEMKEIGVQEIIYTDIARDGMLQGPNLVELEKMGATGLKIVASGGVSTLEDIHNLKQLEDQGVYAAIIGKALYTKDINLSTAIRLARGEN